MYRRRILFFVALLVPFLVLFGWSRVQNPFQLPPAQVVQLDIQNGSTGQVQTLVGRDAQVLYGKLTQMDVHVIGVQGFRMGFGYRITTYTQDKEETFIYQGETTLKKGFLLYEVSAQDGKQLAGMLAVSFLSKFQITLVFFLSSCII